MCSSDLQACCAAAQHMLNAIELQLQGAYGGDPKDIVIVVRGYMGEIAVAKTFNLGWFDHTRLGRVDVGDLIEVRSIDRPDYSLILHDKPKDPDDTPFVLADVSALPRVRLVGWMCASDGRAAVNNEKTDPTGRNRWAYFVPQSAVGGDCRLLRRFAHQEIVKRLLQLEGGNGHQD